MRRITVSLDLPQRQAGKTLLYARHIASSMDGNAYFPAPPVPTATLLGLIDALEQAEVVAMTRAKGTARDRNAKLLAVEDALRQRKAYVQTVANTYADPDEGLAVVRSAGMSVKGPTGPRKPALSVKQADRSGAVTLDVRHPGVSAAHEWQSSTDGETWSRPRRTTRTRIVIDGLTPGLLYRFRHRTLIGEVTSDWSDPLELRVI